MFNKLKSLATKVANKAKSLLGKVTGKKPKKSKPIIAPEPPKVPTPKKPETPNTGVTFNFDERRKALLKGLKHDDEDKLKFGIINILTSLMDEATSEEKYFIAKVEEAIANATDTELDEIQVALGLYSNQDWKDYYESYKDGEDELSLTKAQRMEDIRQVAEILGINIG